MKEIQSLQKQIFKIEGASMTKWEILDIPEGTIIEDFYHDDVRILIMRGPNSLCAYVGVPSNHPLAGFGYDLIPLRCHWGLTYAKAGSKDDWRPEGWWWYGWDYGHCDDAATYDYDQNGNLKDGERYSYLKDRKQWTIKEVHDEAIDVAYDFAKLKELAEKIYIKHIEEKWKEKPL